jgi:cystathionine beta-lyase/cystathionine gamma-synthase
MSKNQLILKKAINSIKKYGIGSGGTRNISGTHQPIVKLEKEIADLHNKESALVFTSGYVANESTISSLTKILKDSIVFSYQDNEDKELLLNDNEYDVIREYVLKTYPNNKTAKNQHADTETKITKNKVKLPYEMWSMDKIKPHTNALNN